MVAPPRVWIGNAQASKSDTFFKEAHIGAVLNMTANEAHHFKNRNIEYMRIPVHDSLGRRDTHLMYTYFPVICEFIYKNAVLEKKDVLVHCHLGQQRSAAAVAAYLIKYYKLSPMQAMAHLRKHKADVFAHGESVNFAASLNKWYKKLQTGSGAELTAPNDKSI